MGGSDKRKILFFTRGWGRGHAIPDLVILDELRALAPAVEWQFVSYAAGFATLTEAGVATVDLQLNDDAPFLEILRRAVKVVAHFRPDAVVSHEEFAALPASKAFDRPTVFLGDFLPSSEVRRESLKYADRILFIEHRGLFPEPSDLRGRVEYLGPFERDAARTRDRYDLPRRRA